MKKIKGYAVLDYKNEVFLSKIFEDSAKGMAEAIDFYDASPRVNKVIVKVEGETIK